jgi:hypothetical protein
MDVGSQSTDMPIDEQTSVADEVVVDSGASLEGSVESEQVQTGSIAPAMEAIEDQVVSAEATVAQTPSIQIESQQFARDNKVAELAPDSPDGGGDQSELNQFTKSQETQSLGTFNRQSKEEKPEPSTSPVELVNPTASTSDTLTSEDVAKAGEAAIRLATNIKPSLASLDQAPVGLDDLVPFDKNVDKLPEGANDFSDINKNSDNVKDATFKLEVEDSPSLLANSNSTLQDSDFNTLSINPIKSSPPDKLAQFDQNFGEAKLDVADQYQDQTKSQRPSELAYEEPSDTTSVADASVVKDRQAAAQRMTSDAPPVSDQNQVLNEVVPTDTQQPKSS